MSSSGPLSPDSSEVSRSLIPQRMATPPALRKMYPKDGADKLAAPNRNVVRKATFTKLNVGVATPDADLDVKLREKDKEEEMPEVGFLNILCLFHTSNERHERQTRASAWNQHFKLEWIFSVECHTL